MNTKYLLFTYYAVIVILLIFTANEYYKQNKKVIAGLTGFVALLTIWFASHNLKRYVA